MTCRHNPGDITCTTQFPGGPLPPTPDSKNFRIVDAEEVNNNLILKVQYPNCALCSFEGTKVMVYLGIGAIDALKWREINPHFRDAKLKPNEGLSPDARFPATENGWEDARAYARNR